MPMSLSSVQATAPSPLRFDRCLHSFALCLPLLLAGCGGSDGSSSAPWPNPSPPPVASPAPIPTPQPLPLPEGNSEITGHEFYFSYDESASTAGRDLSLFALENGRLPDPGWGRIYEFLNAETFDPFAPVEVGPFSISMGLYAADNGELLPAVDDAEVVYTLGVNVTGPTLTLEERRNTVLTLILDISGSMTANYSRSLGPLDSRTLMDVAKAGLTALVSSLKPGDVINLVTFETEAQVVLQHFEFAGDATDYLAALQPIKAAGTTNLEAGIGAGYELALGAYDPEKINRVVMLTDALANVGATDPSLIASNVEIDGREGIYFSGIGIGEGFNDGFLNELTEAGRGAYAAMVTPADAERLFTDQFIRLLDNAMTDVRFKLSFPPSLDYLEQETSAEEVSEDEDDVKPTHFAYNSDQFFLEHFAGTTALGETDEFTLSVSYTAQDGKAATAELTLSAAELLGQGGDVIRSANMVSTLAKLIKGATDCDTTESLTMWAAPVAHPIFDTYWGAADQYCRLRAAAIED